MKPKIQPGTTQKAKEGNNMVFLRPIPTPIFDTNMLTIPWTPTREASLNYSPLWKYGRFQSIFPGLLNYQLQSHAFCHQLVFLPNRFCFSPPGRSLGPCPSPKSMYKCPQQTTWQTPLTGLPFDPWRKSSRDKFPDWPSRFQEKQRVGEKRCHHVPPSSPPPPSSIKQKAMLTLLLKVPSDLVFRLLGHCGSFEYGNSIRLLFSLAQDTPLLVRILRNFGALRAYPEGLAETRSLRKFFAVILFLIAMWIMFPQIKLDNRDNPCL